MYEKELFLRSNFSLNTVEGENWQRIRYTFKGKKSLFSYFMDLLYFPPYTFHLHNSPHTCSKQYESYGQEQRLSQSPPALPLA